MGVITGRASKKCLPRNAGVHRVRISRGRMTQGVFPVRGGSPDYVAA